jgi:hypothetical protein
MEISGEGLTSLVEIIFFQRDGTLGRHPRQSRSISHPFRSSTIPRPCRFDFEHTHPNMEISGEGLTTYFFQQNRTPGRHPRQSRSVSHPFWSGTIPRPCWFDSEHTHPNIEIPVRGLFLFFPLVLNRGLASTGGKCATTVEGLKCAAPSRRVLRRRLRSEEFCQRG